jgi:hypothetical protein
MLTKSIHQWVKNGDHPDDHQAGDNIAYEGRVVRRFRHPGIPSESVCPFCNTRMQDHGWIDSGSQGQTVCPNDYIVTDEYGRYIRIARLRMIELLKDEA